MELHISSDDATYITQVLEFAEDNLDMVDGYVSLNGRDAKGEFHHKIQLNRSSVGKQFPKRVTFGQMLDMMKHAGTDNLYFQREDWRGTHNCIALNKQNASELFLEIYYEDDRYAKGFEQTYEDNNEIPIDCHPYIPTYADMFIHSWIIYRDDDNIIRYTEDNDYDEENINSYDL